MHASPHDRRSCAARTVTLASTGGWFGLEWLSVELAPVLALSALRGIQPGRLRRLARAKPVPAALAIAAAVLAIAALAIVKPF